MKRLTRKPSLRMPPKKVAVVADLSLLNTVTRTRGRPPRPHSSLVGLKTGAMPPSSWSYPTHGLLSFFFPLAPPPLSLLSLLTSRRNFSPAASTYVQVGVMLSHQTWSTLGRLPRPLIPSLISPYPLDPTLLPELAILQQELHLRG